MADAAATALAIGAEMARLRQCYLDRLPGELAELATLANGLAGGDGDRAALEALHHRLHKLAGSGGTFGLPALSDRSRSLEQTIRGWLDGGTGAADESARRDLAAAIAALAPIAGQVAPHVVDSGPATPRPASGRIVQVWLIEDDPLLGQELVRLLEPFGYEVRLFTRIHDAESAARDARPDILIMDVLFPHEGENATEFMSMRPHLAALGCPLIFISSQGDFPSRVRAAHLGAEGYFQKPLDVPRLVDRMEHIFQRRHSAPQRVLVVDDDKSLAEHYRLVLQAAGMEAEVLDRPEGLIDRLSAFRPELVLMDMHMPVYSGTDLAGVIRQHDNWVSLPIVYLSAETDFDRQMQALGRGADDFLTKPIPDEHLVAAVRVRIERARQLTDLISKDGLTGLLKHASIKEAAEIEVLRARRSGRAVAVAMLDIDHFKNVNDTYGHAVGDLVIKSIATVLRQRLRQSDLIGRYGGEEFVIVLPECNVESVHLVLEDIRIRFAALQFTHDGHTFGCTLSAGLACSFHHPDTNAAGLLAIADQALYAAKRAGRNQVCMPAAIEQRDLPS